MPKFDAVQVVEPLEFDFNPHLDLRGTIVEPSEERLSAFFTALTRASKDAPKALKGLEAAGTDPDKLMTAMGKMPDGTLAGMIAGLNRPYAELCGGFPSEEQIARLPPRVRLAFFAWLSGELSPGNSAAGGMTARQTVS